MREERENLGDGGGDGECSAEASTFSLSRMAEERSGLRGIIWLESEFECLRGRREMVEEGLYERAVDSRTFDIVFSYFYTLVIVIGGEVNELN